MANEKGLSEYKSEYKPLSLRKGGNWSPFRELMRFQRNIDRMFEDFFTSPRDYPLVDIEETEGHYLISCELPGIKKEDLTVELKGENLVISGKNKEMSFLRSFTLPGDAKTEGVDANYADGVLEIAIPKQEVRSEKIEIGEKKGKYLEEKKSA